MAPTARHRIWNCVSLNVLYQMAAYLRVHGKAVFPEYIHNINKPVEFPDCNYREAGVCAVQIALGLVEAVSTQECQNLGVPNTRAASLAAIQASLPWSRSFPGTNLGAFVLDYSTGQRLVDTWVPSAVGALPEDKAAYGEVAQPILLKNFQEAVDQGGGWVPHQWRWSPSENPSDVLSYVKKCPVDTGDIIGTTIGRDLLPKVSGSSANFISFGAIKNTRRVVGKCATDLLAARTLSDLDHIFYDITWTDKYVVRPGFYIFMYKLGDLNSTGNEAVGTSWGVNVAHGTAVSLVRNNISTWRAKSNASQYLIDQGASLDVALAQAAVRGGEWYDYTWGVPGTPQGTYWKIAYTVGIMVNRQKYYLGSGFKMSPRSAISGPNCTICDAEGNNACAAANSYSLLASALARALTSIQEDALWNMISRGSADFNFSMGGGFCTFAYDFNGTCVASACDPSQIGKTMWQQLAATNINATVVNQRFVDAAEAGGDWVRFEWKPFGHSYISYITKMYKYGKSFYLGAKFKDATPPVKVDCTAWYAEPCAEYSVHRVIGAANAALLGAANASETHAILQQIAKGESPYGDAARGFLIIPFDQYFKCPAIIRNANACSPDLSGADLLRLIPLNNSDDGGWERLASTTPDGYDIFAYMFPVVTKVGRILLVSNVTYNRAPRCKSNADCPPQSTCIGSGRCKCKLGWVANYSNSGGCSAFSVHSMTCLDRSQQLCTIGGKGIAADGSCSACTPGKYKDGPDTMRIVRSPCLDCQAGKWESQFGSTACSSCTVGRYANGTGLTECEDCRAGSHGPNTGRQTCIPCQPGQFAASSGAVVCTPCRAGRYQMQSTTTACIQCPGEGETTLNDQSDSVTDCVCQAQRYRPRGGTPGTACKTCPTGMTCRAGSAEDALLRTISNAGNWTRPLLEPGYWSAADQPMEIYACVDKSDASPCGGGVPPGCTGGEIGTACSQCPDGWKMTGDGCGECKGWEIVIVIIFLLFLMFAPVVMLHKLKPDHSWRLNAKQALMTNIEILIELGQTVSCLSIMQITWPQVAETGLEFFEGMPFKFYFLDPVESFPCIAPAGLRTDFMAYFGMTMLIPGFAMYMGALYPFCSRWLPQRMKWELNASIHTILKFVNIVFISQVFFTTMPFICYSHPSSNTKESIQSFPAVFCGTSEHAPLLLVGSLSALFCTGFVAYLCWETRQIRKTFASNRDSKALHLYITRITFILEDFTLETYYWNLIAKLLEFLIGGILLVFIPNNTRIQICIYVAIFVTCVYLWVRFAPYKVRLLNVVAAILFGLLVLILALATTEQEEADGTDKRFASACIFLSILIVLLLFAFACILAVVTLCVRGSHGELFAISHCGSIPRHEGLMQMWNDCRKWRNEEVADMLCEWQPHDIKAFSQLLLNFRASDSAERNSNRMSLRVADAKHIASEECRRTIGCISLSADLDLNSWQPENQPEPEPELLTRITEMTCPSKETKASAVQESSIQDSMDIADSSHASKETKASVVQEASIQDSMNKADSSQIAPIPSEPSDETTNVVFEVGPRPNTPRSAPPRCAGVAQQEFKF